MGLTHEINDATGGADENITSFLKLLPLETSRCTAVNNTGAQHGAVAQAASIVEDLRGQLASWTDNQNQRLCSNPIGFRVEVVGDIGARGGQFLSFPHQLG